MKYKILKFKGTKNDETKQVCGGWLYLEFLEKCQTIFKMAVNPKPTERNEGDIIAITVHGSKNRTEAIDFFERNYTIL